LPEAGSGRWVAGEVPGGLTGHNLDVSICPVDAGFRQELPQRSSPILKGSERMWTAARMFEIKRPLFGLVAIAVLVVCGGSTPARAGYELWTCSGTTSGVVLNNLYGDLYLFIEVLVDNAALQLNWTAPDGSSQSLSSTVSDSAVTIYRFGIKLDTKLTFSCTPLDSTKISGVSFSGFRSKPDGIAIEIACNGSGTLYQDFSGYATEILLTAWNNHETPVVLTYVPPSGRSSSATLAPYSSGGYALELGGAYGKITYSCASPVVFIATLDGL
jgi:hypothetical protein